MKNQPQGGDLSRDREDEIEPQIGRKLADGFVLTEIIATTPSSYIYSAEHERGLRCVFKTARKRFLTDFILGEAEHYAYLDEHAPKTVPKFYGLIRDSEDSMGPGLLLEKLDDGNFLTFPRKKAWRKTLRTFVEMARTLERIHECGRVHRDATPKNTFVHHSGRVTMTDLGIAELTGGSFHFTEHGVIAGTVPYMSPEQARGEPADVRDDAYSWGVALLIAATGKADLGNIHGSLFRADPERLSVAELIVEATRERERRPSIGGLARELEELTRDLRAASTRVDARVRIANADTSIFRTHGEAAAETAPPRPREPSIMRRLSPPTAELAPRPRPRTAIAATAQMLMAEATPPPLLDAPSPSPAAPSAAPAAPARARSVILSVALAAAVAAALIPVGMTVQESLEEKIEQQQTAVASSLDELRRQQSSSLRQLNERVSMNEASCRDAATQLEAEREHGTSMEGDLEDLAAHAQRLDRRLTALKKDVESRSAAPSGGPSANAAGSPSESIKPARDPSPGGQDPSDQLGARDAKLLAELEVLSEVLASRELDARDRQNACGRVRAIAVQSDASAAARARELGASASCFTSVVETAGGYHAR